jgi:hypothetical protein
MYDENKRTIIEYEIALLSLPLFLLGGIIGVMFNSYFSSIYEILRQKFF